MHRLFTCASGMFTNLPGLPATSIFAHVHAISTVLILFHGFSRASLHLQALLDDLLKGHRPLNLSLSPAASTSKRASFFISVAAFWGPLESWKSLPAAVFLEGQKGAEQGSRARRIAPPPREARVAGRGHPAALLGRSRRAAPPPGHGPWP